MIQAQICSKKYVQYVGHFDTNSVSKTYSRLFTVSLVAYKRSVTLFAQHLYTDPINCLLVDLCSWFPGPIGRAKT